MCTTNTRIFKPANMSYQLKFKFQSKSKFLVLQDNCFYYCKDIPKKFEVLSSSSIVLAGQHQLVHSEELLIVVLQELAGKLLVTGQGMPMVVNY